jgi:radical SAM enzyme (TIGR01210 family)
MTTITQIQRRQPTAPESAPALTLRIQQVLAACRKSKRKVDDGPEHYAYLAAGPENCFSARGIVGLPTRGCSYARSSWAGCAVCGHHASSLWRRDISDSEILADFEASVRALSVFKPPVLCLYCSGSFLDPAELPETVRARVVARLAGLEWVESVVIESLPHFVDAVALQSVTSAIGGKALTVGMGLDSSSELVRTLCFQRHISNQRYREAVAICRTLSVSSIAYLVHGVPFLDLGQSIFDTATSLRDALEVFGFDSISIEPVALQAGTIQELQKDFDPSYCSPDIWSLAASLATYSALSSMLPEQWAERVVIGGQVFTPLPSETVRGCSLCLKLIEQTLGPSVARVLSTLPLASPGECCRDLCRPAAQPFSENDLLSMVASRLDVLTRTLTPSL